MSKDAGVARETLRHTAVYSVATLLGRSLGFLLLPIYAHMFKTEGYGVLGIIDASLGLLSISLAAGFHNAVVKFYHEEDEERRARVVPTACWLAWGLSSAIVAVPLFISPSISEFLLGDPSYYPHVSLALVTFVVDIGAQSASTYLVIQRRSVLYSVVGIIRLFVGLLLNIWLVVILRIGLIGFFIASLVTATIALGIFLVPLVRVSGMKFDRDLGRRILRFQLPLVPGDLLAYVSRQVERFAVRFLLSLESVGVLEMGYKFPPLLNMVAVQPFMRAWQTKYYELAPTDEAPRTLGSMFTKYFFVLAFLGLLMAVNVENLIVVLTPPEFWAAARIARIEIVTAVMAGVNAYMVLGILFQKRTAKLGVIRLTAAPAKIALSFLFISTLGLGGAAYSALVVEVGLALWIGISAQRIYHIDLEYGKVIVIAAVAFLMTVLLNGIRYDTYAFATSAKEFVDGTVSAVFAALPPEVSGDRLLRLFREREDRVVASIFSTLLSLSFLVLVPWASPGFLDGIASRVLPRWSSSGSSR